MPPIQLRIRDGGRARQDGVDDEAGEEEEEPKLEHDKHEGHCMVGSAATSNLGSEGRGGKRPKILVVGHPKRPLHLIQWGAVAQRVVDGNESAGDERRRGDGHDEEVR